MATSPPPAGTVHKGLNLPIEIVQTIDEIVKEQGRGANFTTVLIAILEDYFATGSKRIDVDRELLRMFTENPQEIRAIIDGPVREIVRDELQKLQFHVKSP
jgi:hypothetical protein